MKTAVDAGAAMRARLIGVGILVVAGCVVMSLLVTHLSYVILGSARYEVAMTASAVVPLMIAPPCYAFIARLSLRLMRANGELELLAYRDSLTGLLNRRAIMDEIVKRMDAGTRVSIAIADADHFKRINDQMGHAVGDMALVHIATMLRRNLSPSTLVGRIGGEEFLLLFADTDDDAVILAVEAMRRQIAAVPLVTAAGSRRVTASFGVAHALPGERADALLSRADKALYDAKDAGRNRCMKAA